MEEEGLKQLNRSRGGGGGSATYIIWRGGLLIRMRKGHCIIINRLLFEGTLMPVTSSPPMGAAAQ